MYKILRILFPCLIMLFQCKSGHAATRTSWFIPSARPMEVGRWEFGLGAWAQLTDIGVPVVEYCVPIVYLDASLSESFSLTMSTTFLDGVMLFEQPGTNSTVQAIPEVSIGGVWHIVKAEPFSLAPYLQVKARRDLWLHYRIVGGILAEGGGSILRMDAGMAIYSIGNAVDEGFLSWEYWYSNPVFDSLPEVGLTLRLPQAKSLRYRLGMLYDLPTFKVMWSGKTWYADVATASRGGNPAKYSITVGRGF